MSLGEDLSLVYIPTRNDTISLKFFEGVCNEKDVFCSNVPA